MCILFLWPVPCSYSYVTTCFFSLKSAWNPDTISQKPKIWKSNMTRGLSSFGKLRTSAPSMLDHPGTASNPSSDIKVILCDTQGHKTNFQHINIWILEVSEEEEKRERVWENIWRDYSQKLAQPMERETHPSLGSTGSPRQDRRKEEHTPRHSNQTNKN